MIEELNLDPLQDLPEDLAELDAALRDISMAERPSFEPELRAELRRAWREGPPPEDASVAARRALAASVGAVLFVGMMVPPARAAIAELSRQSLQILGVVEASVSVPPSPGPVPLSAVVDASPSAREAEPTAPREADLLAGDDQGPASAEAPAEEAREAPAELPRFAPVELTVPELIDRNADEEAIRRYYPARLEEEGIGGSVFVRLWVDSAGTVDDIEVVEGSGYPEMDDAAAQAAEELRFRPATRGTRAVGTLVEFEMTFDPLPSARRVEPMERPEAPRGLDTDFGSLWPDGAVVPAPYQVEAQQLLRSALGRPADLERRFGSVENLLAGEPPPGASPLRWRASATAALEEGLTRDPGNPAPYLALGRIRKRQGLRDDALALFRDGVERASGGSRLVSPRLLAELSYEHGVALGDAWLGVRDLGRVPTEAVEGARCAQGWHGASTVDEIVGLNYLCSQETRRMMEESFQAAGSTGELRERMTRAFRDAVAAHPAHVGANVELLLDRADQGRWMDVLNGARSFAWASGGEPRALLLSGLALQRLGRPDEALADFELAMRTLPEEEAALLGDARPLMSPDQRTVLAGLPDSAAGARVAAFWQAHDPVLLTEVNERRVEHLARTTWALLRLGGPETEAGEVWVRYGRPSAVRTLGEGTGLRTEFWDYGRGPAITFRRPTHSADLTLTPEARAYLSDLSPTLPHMYGRRARPVASLEAQVARFGATGTAAAEVAVHTRVPGDLATGETDTVHVGLFVTGPDGEILSTRRRTLPAVAADVRMRAPVPSGAERVVLELYHPGLGHAAAVRAPARRDLVRGEDPGVSDLVLTDPARPPTRDVRRHAPWITPRTRGDDARGDVVGLLFELYGAKLDPGPYYRLGVELEREEARAIIPVPIRPAGEGRFELEWPRTPVDGPEFVTMDLADVEPGRYTLRLVVGRPGSGGAVVAERAVER